MDRLTFMSDGYYAVSDDNCFDDQDENYCGPAISRLAAYEDTELKPEEIEGLKNTCDQLYGINDSLFKANQAMGKDLVAYKGTGLEPEQVTELKGFIQGGVHKVDDGWAHVQELLKAEQEGRLVELPCKVGQPVWFIRPGVRKQEITETAVEKMVVKAGGIYMKLDCNAMYETSCRSIGKTVFLTREEAEKALKGGNAE